MAVIRVASGQWSVARKTVISDQWSVVSKQISDQWSVASGQSKEQWPVVSGQWSVRANRAGVFTGHWPLTTDPCLQGHWQLLSRGQTAIEHAVLTAVLVAALLGMAIVTKRAVMGRWRAVGDTFGAGRQYDPAKTVASGP